MARLWAWAFTSENHRLDWTLRMTTQQVVILVLQVSILLTVFGFGLQTTLHDLQYLVRRPALLARSLLAMFVIMPIVAVILVRAFELRPSFEIALLALAISPVPPLLPGKEGKAAGHAAYGLALMAVVSILAIVVVPLWVQLLGRYFDRQLQMPPAAIAKVVVVMTILPLITGVIVRTLLPAVATRLEKPARLVSTVLLLAGALALVIAAMPVIWSVTEPGILRGGDGVRPGRAGCRALARRPAGRRLDRPGALHRQPASRHCARRREAQLSRRAASRGHDSAVPDPAHRAHRART